MSYCPRCPCADCEKQRTATLPDPIVPTLPWEPAPVRAPQPLPTRWGRDTTLPFDPEDRYRECTIARYFRDNPHETSVLLYCGCRWCSPHSL